MAMVDYLVMGFGLAACSGSLCGGVLIAFDSPAPEKLKAEEAEPIRNGESLMDPPCLHRISRPSGAAAHSSGGSAHSSGGATRPSLTSSRPASAPIRTDRSEAEPTARMPPSNHGDERKETRHVASAGHRPHPTRSRSYVSSPAELQDAVPPLDAPRDAERRRSFDGLESEMAGLMRDSDYNGCYPHGGPFETREGNYAYYPGYHAHGGGMLARPHSHPNMHPRPQQCASEGDETQQRRYYQHHQHHQQQQQAQQQQMYYQQQCHQYQQYLQQQQQQQEQNREQQPQQQHQQQEQEQEQQQDYRRFHSNQYPHPLPLQKPVHTRSHTPPFPPAYHPPHAPDFPSHAPPRCPPAYPPSAFPSRPAGAPICPLAQRQQGSAGEQTAHRQLEQGLRTLPRLKV